MKHPEKLIENETPFETGERASYMRYDAIEQMLRGKAKGFSDQAIKDEEKTYKRLSRDGRKIAKLLEEAADIAAEMWEYSEPRMREKGEI